MVTKVSSPHEPLCLRFANTAGFHALGDRVEEITSARALVDWGREAGILTRHEAARQALAVRDAATSEELLRRAVELRDAIQSLFSRIARRRPPAPSSLTQLNEAYGRAMANSQILTEGSGAWTVGWKKSDDPERILWPVARSAAELLTSPDLARLKECSGRDCSRLFLDRSRNGTRRWCSMEGCGNRAKVRRHYRRSREK